LELRDSTWVLFLSLDTFFTLTRTYMGTTSDTSESKACMKVRTTTELSEFMVLLPERAAAINDRYVTVIASMAIVPDNGNSLCFPCLRNDLLYFPVPVKDYGDNDRSHHNACEVAHVTYKAEKHGIFKTVNASLAKQNLKQK
jgi:hypothetical protein